MNSFPSDPSDPGISPGPGGGSGRTTFVVVRAGGTRYCLDVAGVREIISPGPVTVVPGAEPMTMGVINVRGRVLALADLTVVLGKGLSANSEPGVATCGTALVLDLPFPREMAVAVDEVLDVVELPDESLQPPPAFGLGEAAPFALAVATLEDGLVVVLGAEGLFGERPGTPVDGPVEAGVGEAG